MIPPAGVGFNVGLGSAGEGFASNPVVKQRKLLTRADGSEYHGQVPPLWASAPGREAAEWQPQLF